MIGGVWESTFRGILRVVAVVDAYASTNQMHENLGTFFGRVENLT